MTVVTPDGKLVIASATNEHSGLFHALPGSCGTLGFIISATIRVNSVDCDPDSLSLAFILAVC